ncbi:hypothetical protein NPIL_320581 [Nephila pilipes]|uniref:RNase H type-1 domain-containing protein n=1 Tax=Nephila pilipes TaxID=299642 RepID=A0A8X6QZV4_NEPPI|nr:hypothetical protein NPIL_320581 [Nephila pilipes]
MRKVKQVVRKLIMNCKIVEFLWMSSYVVKDGNKRADQLTKRGTKSHIEDITISLDSLKRCVHEKIMLKYSIDLSNQSRNKSWENIVNVWKEFSHRSLKEVVANHRLKTRHDYLKEHQKTIGILTNSLCPFCKANTVNKEYLLLTFRGP